MKIVAISGSPNFSNSSCNNLIKALQKEFEKNFSNLDIINYHLAEHNILYCTGCLNCFKKGTCSINDDLDNLKRLLLSSDIIIIASPVYFHDVPACLKNIIDRLTIGHIEWS